MATYATTSGKTVTASNAAKLPIQLFIPANASMKLIAFDVSFDGTDSTKTPILCEVVKETGLTSGHGTATPTQTTGITRTAQTLAYTNGTADGSGPTVIQSWLISPTAAFSYQWPLGREVEVAGSAYVALRVTTVTASGTPNYQVGVTWEE